MRLEHKNRPRPMGSLLLRGASIALAALVLAGCASMSPEASLDAVRKATGDHLGASAQLIWARQPDDQTRIDQRVAELLGKPLGMDEAVQVALINNRGLQAAYSELGITEAQVVQAGRLPNPGVSFGRLTQGDEVELERGFHLSLARLLVLPWVQQMEARRLEQAQMSLAARVLSLAADTRKAWIQAVAAQESVRYSRQVMQAAEASAELARRMAQVGNFINYSRRESRLSTRMQRLTWCALSNISGLPANV